MLGGFPQTGASFYHFMCVFSHSLLIHASLKLTIPITSITIIYSVCADSLHSLPHPLSFLSSSSVVLVVDMLDVRPAPLTATTVVPWTTEQYHSFTKFTHNNNTVGAVRTYVCTHVYRFKHILTCFTSGNILHCWCCTPRAMTVEEGDGGTTSSLSPFEC